MKQDGFTLVEMLVVVSIMSILAAWAVPSMSKWVQEYKLRSHANKIANDLNDKRDEALQTSDDVEYDIENGTNITVTAPSGKTKKIEFNAQGKTQQGGRLIYKVKSSKVGTEYAVVIPAYGSIMVWKQ